MARGRELAAQYKGKERHEVRWKEVDEGKLKMPREGENAIRTVGQGLRCGQRRGDGCLPAVGCLFPMRRPNRRTIDDIKGQLPG